jgi:hypothetical protein
MPTSGECREEIENLHAFFVRWYCGTAEQDEFDRVEQALGASFERVGPDGTIHVRETVRDGIRSQYDTHDPGSFDIEIRNVELIESTGEQTLVRYESGRRRPRERMVE